MKELWPNREVRVMFGLRYAIRHGTVTLMSSQLQVTVTRTTRNVGLVAKWSSRDVNSPIGKHVFRISVRRFSSVYVL